MDHTINNRYSFLKFALENVSSIQDLGSVLMENLPKSVGNMALVAGGELENQSFFYRYQTHSEVEEYIVQRCITIMKNLSLVLDRRSVKGKFGLRRCEVERSYLHSPSGIVEDSPTLLISDPRGSVQVRLTNGSSLRFETPGMSDIPVPEDIISLWETHVSQISMLFNGPDESLNIFFKSNQNNA